MAEPRPSGLVAHRSGDGVVLSWWGAAGATAYRVKRATAAGGPHTTVAPAVQDPLTWTDRALPPGEYVYLVTALRDGVETTTSEPLAVSTVTRLRTHVAFDGDQAEPCTLVGGAKRVAGRVGQAVALDGQDGHVALPTSLVRDLADFTITAWVRLSAEQTWARVFEFGDARGQSMWLTPRSDGGTVRFGVSTVYGYNAQRIDGREPLPTGRWVHLAVSLAGRIGTLYVDGVAVGTDPAIDFPPYRLGDTDRNWIGRSGYANDPYLHGEIDDFRLYDGALSAAEVAALARESAGPG